MPSKTSSELPASASLALDEAYLRAATGETSVEDAVAVCEAVRREHGEGWEVDECLGKLRRLSGDRHEAKVLLLRALDLAPPDCRAVPNADLGDLLAEEGDVDGAVARYRAALAESPNEPTILVAMGRVLVDSGRGREAIGPLEQALELSKQYVEAHYLLARAYYVAQQWNESAAHARRAAELAGAYPEARIVAGSALEKAGRLQEALAEYAKVSGPPALRAQALAGSAYACVGAKRYAEGLAYIRKAERILPTVGMYWSIEASAHAGLGDREQAAACCRRAYQLGDRVHAAEGLRAIGEWPLEPNAPGT